MKAQSTTYGFFVRYQIVLQVPLRAIYYGINIDKSDKSNKKLLGKLVEKAYPHCRIYQSELANNSYNLCFTRLNKPWGHLY